MVPELFNGPVIGYWQTVGLLILSKILFSGIGYGRSHDHHYDQSRRESWKRKFHEKINGIAEEDKNDKEE